MSARRLVPLALAVGLAAAAVTGCSSDSSTSPSESATTLAPSSAAPSDSTAVLPPVMVAEDQDEVTAKVGDTIVFDVQDPGAWQIATSDPALLEVTQGGPEGSAVFNPGAVALAAGKATITLTPDTGEPRIVIVTIDAA